MRARAEGTARVLAMQVGLLSGCAFLLVRLLRLTT